MYSWYSWCLTNHLLYFPFYSFSSLSYIWKFDSWAVYNKLIDWLSYYIHRYFLLVVAVYAHSKNKEYLVCANVSERIIVRVRSLLLFIMSWEMLIEAANNNSIIKLCASKICPCLTKNHTPSCTHHSFIRGGSAPRSKPLPFYIPYLLEKVPFFYTFY